MGWVRSGARHGLRYRVFGLAAVVAGLIGSSGAADARHHYYRVHAHFVHHALRVHSRVHVQAYAPPVASIVVDGNSGEVLQASNADALRHPASLTKIMTLYLLFERLDAGTIRLDTPIKVSVHATEQAPTKLGVKAGQSIPVDEAIKAVVTRSANDIAVAIAENLAGSEEEFAKLMTQKAHALGMSRTNYVNASGLPDDDQITTARDLSLLGRSVQERFPRYYRYFALREFVYHGVAIRNHDHLLGAVSGVDGIKTGYTRASGFNLVTSLHRDGRYVVAVVIGGRSALSRDAHMRELLNAHIKEASIRHGAPVVAERTEQRSDPQPPATPRAKLPRTEPQPGALAKVPPPAPRTDPTPTATVAARAGVGSSDPIQPVLVRTITFRTAPAQTASLAPMPALVPSASPSPSPAAAPAVRPQPAAQLPETPPSIVVASAEPGAIATSTKSEPSRTASAKAELVRQEQQAAEPAAPQIHAHGGWLIQIGAFEGEDEARQHLTAAQLKARAMLGAADPFTERVQKGDKALYRARFAGFDKQTAEAACKQLKRSDIECMALKN